jgi:Ca-activated chloride channel homolog
MPTLAIGHPWFLLGLLVIPVLLVFLYRSRYLLSSTRRVLVAITRTLVVALVVLAIADVRIAFPTDELAIAAVIDSSASIDPREQAEIRSRLAAIDEDADVSEIAGDDDVATKLRLAVAELPTDRARRIALYTDGRDPTGEVRPAIDAARRAGVPVFLMAAGDAPVVDVLALSELEVPRLVRAGETIDVGLVLFASERTNAHVVLRLDGEIESEADVTATPGVSMQRLELTFPEDEGVVALSATVTTAGDSIAENDRFDTLVRVTSRPRVLLIHEPNETPLLAQVLEDAKFSVDLRTPADAPEDVASLDPYGLVVIDEVKLTDVREETQVAVRTWVEELGGGLVTVSGQNGFRREPPTLREIEPVRRPPAIPEPRPLELVLTIDRSGSMDGRPMAQARAASVAAVNALRRDARIGTVAFSGGADHVMAPVNVEEAGNEATGFISRIQAGGGTDIAAALNASGAIMSDDPRYIHHIILLSDGYSDEAAAIGAASALAARGITISTITIGDYSPLLAQIAAIGRGRYHATRNLGSLPALMVREAQYRQPPAHREVRFTPTVVTSHPMVRDIDFAGGAPLLGHALASMKPGADMILSASDAQSPLLGHWHVGVGQVATFTSATTGGWANEWRGWPGFRTFWTQVAWNMLRKRTVDPLEIRIEPVFRSTHLREVLVLAPDVRATEAPAVLLHRTADLAGEPLELEPVGPGVFRSVLPLDSGFLVTARLESDPEPTAAAAADAGYDDELRSFGADARALESWAEVGGGKLVTADAGLFEPAPDVHVGRSIALGLLACALVLYLLGILLLRLPERRAVAARASATKPEVERRKAA